MFDHWSLERRQTWRGPFHEIRDIFDVSDVRWPAFDQVPSYQLPVFSDG